MGEGEGGGGWGIWFYVDAHKNNFTNIVFENLSFYDNRQLISITVTDILPVSVIFVVWSVIVDAFLFCEDLRRSLIVRIQVFGLRGCIPSLRSISILGITFFGITFFRQTYANKKTHSKQA